MSYKQILTFTFVAGLSAAIAQTQPPPPASSSSQPHTSHSAAASKSSTETGALSGSDRTFVRKAAEGGVAEVQLGQLAKEKGSNSAVKDFGDRMMKDHSKANDNLKSVATSKGATVPDTMSAKDQALYNRLSKLSGSEFDKAYMGAMVKDHEEDVAEFRKESQAAKDTDLRNFASQTLPTLEDHLRMARDTASKVGVTTGTTARKD